MPEPVRLPRTTPPAGGPSAEIPKILWTYWNQPQLDAFVQQCVGSWHRQCPDHRVIVVGPHNVLEHVDPGDLPAQFDQLHPTKQSDWLRLYLVARHGGYWFDATTLLTCPPDWMAAQNGPSGELTGFYLEGFTQDLRYPVIESWAFCAPAGSRFVSEWQKEFHQALVIEGTQAYLQRLRAQPDASAVLQRIPDPEYLLIHVTAQRVMRRMPDALLTLFKAEDTAFFYHSALRWKWYLLYPQLCLAPGPKVPAPIVKLRGGERRHFTQLLELHGGAAPHSLWSRALSSR
ncbi:MAG: capsular polysaccharide synthesis protein [Burkholderiaceae bacterium]|nr:capsular polysaccharide synthesis protein [Burkholderiaceae bacterium]